MCEYKYIAVEFGYKNIDKFYLCKWIWDSEIRSVTTVLLSSLVIIFFKKI